jgi:hypothetical protein
MILDQDRFLPQNKVNKIKVTISISIGWVTTAELPERGKKMIF